MPKKILWMGALLCAAAFAGGAGQLRVMTFNVRYPAASDGPNRWEARRDILVASVKAENPDLFGTQELFYEQGQYIVEKAPEYAWFGVSRRGDRTDEHMGVFYKPGVLRLLESGNFWLSETPDAPGSMSWDVTLPRMVTWGLFEVKASGKKFYMYNTHFPHRSEDGAARVKCAELIQRHISRLPKDVPFVLLGDFNTGVGSEPYRVIAAGLTDAWATAKVKSGPNGTFHGFKGTPGETRIDWILFRGFAGAPEVGTVTRNDGGRYPSDHFPVFATLDF
ncbi:MAG: endonuclease/exonuclease/phosphatase family protein [Acidobacteria bacterium]|nr:endonuclease/exonuclease/phosphatase family protein [Acidobacteriota bacterium]